MKPPTVHKYAGDDPTATRTACGLPIRWCVLTDLHLTPANTMVDADVRKVTCGNCQRRSHVRYRFVPRIAAEVRS